MTALAPSVARELEHEYVAHRDHVLGMLHAKFPRVGEPEELYHDAWAEAPAGEPDRPCAARHGRRAMLRRDRSPAGRPPPSSYANMRSVTSQGSPYARFRRALQTGNLLLIRSAAAELPVVQLDDALAVCLAIRASDPAQFERAALRWLGRFAMERARSIAEVRDAAAAFAELRRDEAGAVERLRSLGRP